MVLLCVFKLISFCSQSKPDYGCGYGRKTKQKDVMKGGNNMTQNQIAYFQAVETARANRAREQETARSNRANETLTGRNIDVNQGHYLRSDQNTVIGNIETQRSNRAREGIQRSQIEKDYAVLAENRRNNLANNAIGVMNANTTASRAVWQNVLDQEKAVQSKADANLKLAQAHVADSQAQLNVAQTQKAQADRDYATTQTYFYPYSVWSNMVGGASKIIGGIK